MAAVVGADTASGVRVPAPRAPWGDRVQATVVTISMVSITRRASG